MGDDEVKHYDEKESDGGEVSSPASHDHHDSQLPFSEGEKEEIEKREGSSSVQSIAPEKNSVDGINNGEDTQKVVTEEEVVVQIEWNLKSEKDYKSKDLSIETTKDVHDGGSSGSSSSSSSSSSSDDESHAVEKKTVLVETVQVVDSVKHVESLLEEVAQGNDSITNGVVETLPAINSVELADSLSEVLSQVNDSIPVGETNNDNVENTSVVEPAKVSLVEQVDQVIESASIDNPMPSCVVESDLRENGEKKFPSLDEGSPVQMDSGSRKEDEMVSASEDIAAVILDARDSATEVHEDNLVLSYSAPSDTNNSAELVKDPESHKCSDNQPLIASAPRPVQRTSLKSCCGIFELFTGPDR